MAFEDHLEEDHNPYWEKITEIAKKQREKGIKDYGQGLEDNTDPNLKERVTYIEEELVDALMYLEWLKDNGNASKKIIPYTTLNDLASMNYKEICEREKDLYAIQVKAGEDFYRVSNIVKEVSCNWGIKKMVVYLNSVRKEDINTIKLCYTES